MTLLWKLLRSHLSVAQTVGFALAGVVGMTIVLTSVQAYRDVMPVFDASPSPGSYFHFLEATSRKRSGTASKNR